MISIKRISHICFLIFMMSLLSMMIVPSYAESGDKIAVKTNRLVILDDPSGWVKGWGANSAKGDQVFGEETTIRWYALVMNSSGGVPSINVDTKLYFPNGTLHYSDTKATDNKGFVDFSKDLDNLNQRPYFANSTEGYWQINTSASINNEIIYDNTTFIYDEYGCGKSGPYCHRSFDWQRIGMSNKNFTNGNRWISASKNSPYVRNIDNIHGIYGHGNVNYMPDQILSGECIICHKSYNDTYINASIREYYEPQYPGGVHQNKAGANCTSCHWIYDTNNSVSDMPIKRCYECHNNIINADYIQNDTMSYSYDVIKTTNTVRSHNKEIPCIICHNSGHEIEIKRCQNCHITVPTNHMITEPQYSQYTNNECLSCHIDPHNIKLGCIDCHRLSE